jgi:hypothetical protein
VTAHDITSLKAYPSKEWPEVVMKPDPNIFGCEQRPRRGIKKEIYLK